MTEVAPIRRTPKTRISLIRVAVVVLSTVVVGWTGVHAIAASVMPPPAPGLTSFAAYVDVTVTPFYPFETPSEPAQSNVILAFVVADPASNCTPSWGGAYTLDKAGSELQLDRRIAQLRLTAGQARVSFGGQRGPEIASVCTDPAALAAAYQSVVDRYELTSIDLDLEGATLDDVAGAARRATAIKAVQDHEKAAGRSLIVSLTLPVSPDGLTASGLSAVTGMLAAGVDIGIVNAMTMDFGADPLRPAPLSERVLKAATAVHAQVSAAWLDAGQRLNDADAWARVGITPMIGQNDVAPEQFTLADAVTVNEFARAHGVGLLSMWSLNRDATCGPPLPRVLPVVQTSCSGVDQGNSRFSDVLWAQLDETPSRPAIAPPSATPSSASPTTPAAVEDDPANSPFPIWDALGVYQAGTKIVWHHQVFVAKFWTSGFAPDTPVTAAADTPWSLVGPVLPGDSPAPLPTMPSGTYPQWDPMKAYFAGTRVQMGLVPYQAKWWTQGQQPGISAVGGAPWLLVTSVG